VFHGIERTHHDERNGSSLIVDVASGTCTNFGTSVRSAPVSFPAIDLPQVPLVPGFTVDGPLIHLDGSAPGTIDLGNGPLSLLVFTTVDCSSCGTPGWTELHSLFWDPARRSMTFGILYLEQLNPNAVLFDYGLSFPGLQDFGGTSLQATWTLRP
jgi:hypothetical protein